MKSILLLSLIVTASACDPPARADGLAVASSPVTLPFASDEEPSNALNPDRRLTLVIRGPKPPVSDKAAAGIISELAMMAKATGWTVEVATIKPIPIPPVVIDK